MLWASIIYYTKYVFLNAPKNQLGKKKSTEPQGIHYSSFLKILSKEMYAFIILKEALYSSERKQNHSAEVPDLEMAVRWGSP